MATTLNAQETRLCCGPRTRPARQGLAAEDRQQRPGPQQQERGVEDPVREGVHPRGGGGGRGPRGLPVGSRGGRPVGLAEQERGGGGEIPQSGTTKPMPEGWVQTCPELC